MKMSTIKRYSLLEINILLGLEYLYDLLISRLLVWLPLQIIECYDLHNLMLCFALLLINPLVGHNKPRRDRYL